jgi:hypothetical protein
MTNNATATFLPLINTYYKIAGTTTAGIAARFSTANNRFTYTGKDAITSKILVVMGAKSPVTSGDFSIVIFKNGVAPTHYEIFHILFSK